MRYLLTSAFFATLLLCVRCAQQTSPTGGPQDTIPPILIKSTPPNGTVNFKGNTIELLFDEMVMINNPREQLIITPSLDSKIEMEARKNNVILNLNVELNDSTTYTINFRESIQDVTEKNSAENLQLAFSTGTYLDSLSINGNISDLLSGKEVKDGTVALYYPSDTFDIFKHKPIYLTKSDEKGNFQFNNLKPDVYQIYAFNDKNKNLIVDSKSERYGFISQPLHLKPDSSYQFSIPILALDARELKLISAKPFNTYFNIKTSKNLNSYHITAVNPTDSTILRHVYGEDQTSVHLFFTSQPNDSIPIQFHASDTIGNSLDTLLYAKISPRKSTPEKFQVSFEKPTIITDKKLLTAEITVNKPLIALTLDSIDYQVDSIRSVNFNLDDVTWNKERTRLTLNKSLSQDELPLPQNGPNKPTDKNPVSINKLRVKKSFFISIDGDSSQKMEQQPTILSPETSGVIIAEASTKAKNFILQILSQDNKILQSVINTHRTSFTHLAPGNYQLRLIIDKNGNQHWDPGNFYNKEQPEPIIYYTNELNEQNINIKANWELGPLLISDSNLVDNP